METKSPIDVARWDLLWGVQRSQRYHARRSAFFDRWNKATALVGILAGSAVMATLGAYLPHWIAIAGALAIIIMSGVDLVAGAAEMARRHDSLRRRYCELEALIAANPHPRDVQLAEWQAGRLRIESDEPPTYVALDILCDNELARAYRHLHDRPPHRLPLVVRLTAQLVRWENA
ncbi:hypothetical protein CS053_08285 [Rhodanobacter glycinis]|uniref:SLATT domain-containing protein n=1 Tax=Rhodanobacter glycinis TaxID=582702 RepID=A0A5B9DY47_9GAMM|nr:hypothetical protein [Rhodanobacter glycinis]QEE24498.1 hypothetical protein CS053_08285 [Rhodanobacter glycinis]